MIAFILGALLALTVPITVAPSPTPGIISYSPSGTLTFTTIGQAQTITFTAPNGANTFSVAAPSTSGIVSYPQFASGANTLAITSVANGSTTVPVTDANGDTATISIVVSASSTPAPTTAPTIAASGSIAPSIAGQPTVSPTGAAQVATTSTTPPYGSGTRTNIFENNAGSTWQQTDTGDGQLESQIPTWSVTPATCDTNSFPNCHGQAGAARFYITRPNATAAQNPGGSWRSFQTSEEDAPLTAGQAYDVIFRITGNSPQDPQGSQNLVWQLHPSPGSVATNLGLENDQTSGTWWYLNVAAQNGFSNANRNRIWQMPYTAGQTYVFEFQFNNASDSTGFFDAYLNGKLIYSYTGTGIVPNTSYNELGWGVYEYHWENANDTSTTSLFQDITFSTMDIYRIPGRLAPFTVPS